MPGTAVRVFPIFAVPVIVGVGTPVINGNVTAAVATLVFDVFEYPAFFAVTVTVIVEPKSVDFTTYVAAVAETTGLPPTLH